MSEPGLIRADMREIVGRPFGRKVSYPIGASDIRRWAQATCYPEPPPPRYTDPHVQDRLTAPLDFNAFAWGPAEEVPDTRTIEVDPEYVKVGAMEFRLGIPPPDLRRALNGGVSATYTGVRMRPGDVIVAESVIAGYSEREGRLGRMLLTDLDTTWSAQDGRTVKTHRVTLIRY